MRTTSTLLALGAAAVLIALPVAADAAPSLFNFSYSFSGVSASGIFTTTNQGSEYLVTGVTGSRNGVSITGLGTFGGPDQVLFPAQTVPVDFSGITYTLLGGEEINLFESNAFPGTTSEFTVNGDLPPNGGFILTVTPVSTAVPEPASMALLGTGLVGLGMVARRRKGV